MKKILLIASVFAISASTFGQVYHGQITNEKLNDAPYQDEHRVISKSNPYQQNVRRAPNQGWFNTAAANFAAVGATSEFYSNFFLYPDTLGKIIYTEEDGFMRWQIIGQTFDPKFEGYNLVQDGFSTSRFMSYNLDSLRFIRAYLRQVDSVDLGNGNTEVVDTVFIEYFQRANMSLFTQGTNPISNVIALPNINNFRTKTLLNSAAIKRDTIFLRNGDGNTFDFTTGAIDFGRSLETIPVTGFNVPAAPGGGALTAKASMSGVIATHIMFKPMIPFVVGDTILDYKGENSQVKKHNSYATSMYFRENVPFASDQSYNCSYNSGWEVSSGQSIGALKSYIPFSSYATYRASSFDYYITIPNYNLGAKSLESIGIKVGDIYPNPSAYGVANLSITSENSSTASIKVINMNGQELANSTMELNPGENTLSIDTKSFGTGIVNISIEVDGITYNQKVIVK